MHWLAVKQAILFSAWQPIEVLLGEQSSDEENQETFAVISKCRDAEKS
jgi:hypothetical protein